MTVTPGTPSIIWKQQPAAKAYEAVEDPNKKSQTGCVYCLFTGTHAPLEVVYLWGGTSVCQKHLILIKEGSL